MVVAIRNKAGAVLKGAGVATLALAVLGCGALDNLGKVGASFSKKSGEAAIATPTLERYDSLGSRLGGGFKMRKPNYGPALGTIRKVMNTKVVYNVALRGGVGETRKYVVQREDLQMMWRITKSRNKAIALATEAFAKDSCPGGASSFKVTKAEREPIGVWIIHASCAAGATAMALN